MRTAPRFCTSSTFSATTDLLWIWLLVLRLITEGWCAGSEKEVRPPIHPRQRVVCLLSSLAFHSRGQDEAEGSRGYKNSATYKSFFEVWALHLSNCRNEWMALLTYKMLCLLLHCTHLSRRLLSPLLALTVTRLSAAGSPPQNNDDDRETEERNQLGIVIAAIHSAFFQQIALPKEIIILCGQDGTNHHLISLTANHWCFLVLDGGGDWNYPQTFILVDSHPEAFITQLPTRKESLSSTQINHGNYSVWLYVLKMERERVKGKGKQGRRATWSFTIGLSPCVSDAIYKCYIGYFYRRLSMKLCHCY